jgi:hypothetical protein
MINFKCGSRRLGSHGEFVFDLWMPRVPAGAAVAARDRDIARDDALGHYLFAQPA